MNRINTLLLVGCMVLLSFDNMAHLNQVQAFNILPLRHKKSSIKSISFWKFNPGNSMDIQHDNNKKKNRFIKHSRSKRTTFKTAMASLVIYSTVLLRTPHVANANHPLENAPTGRISLKPGATIESMQQELELRNELTIEELARSSTATGGVSGTSSSTKKDSVKKSFSSQKHSKEEDDEYDNFEEDDDDMMESSTFTKDRNNIHSSSSAMDLSNSNVAKTVTKFSGSAPTMSSKTKNQQVAKTVVKIMGPIFGFCFARETIRWNREQKNVDKGIEIMEQQRREYLNMKQEEEEEDDDDEDSDDEDSDEDSDSDEEE